MHCQTVFKHTHIYSIVQQIEFKEHYIWSDEEFDLRLDESDEEEFSGVSPIVGKSGAAKKPKPKGVMSRTDFWRQHPATVWTHVSVL